MSTRTTFIWEFRVSSPWESTFAEAQLSQVGRPSSERYMMHVHLVRDEMREPDASQGSVVFDPERRVGQRIYVGASCTDDCRLLAYLAPKEGERLAYKLICNVLRENQDQVRRFGDDWLIETICGAQPDKEAVDG